MRDTKVLYVIETKRQNGEVVKYAPTGTQVFQIRVMSGRVELCYRHT